ACLFSADNCLTAILGETVDIPCSLNTTEPFKRENISVGWTTAKGDNVHTFINGKDDLENQDPQFKGRTELYRFNQSNFSLRLSNVSKNDEGEYICGYFRDGEKRSIVLSEHCLKVKGEESLCVNLACSTTGYPKPKVHWSVNKKPFQNSSQVNTRLSTDNMGLYNVTSDLTLNVTGDIHVCITKTSLTSPTRAPCGDPRSLPVSPGRDFCLQPVFPNQFSRLQQNQHSFLCPEKYLKMLNK
uniref:Ig-like domain-containing protein n=1 Tax=Erpetoichthys calabaricus TaxID=27687 RepID=A0A8C4XCZ8_ERPCA